MPVKTTISDYFAQVFQLFSDRNPATKQVYFLDAFYLVSKGGIMLIVARRSLFKQQSEIIKELRLQNERQSGGISRNKKLSNIAEGEKRPGEVSDAVNDGSWRKLDPLLNRAKFPLAKPDGTKD